MFHNKNKPKIKSVNIEDSCFTYPCEHVVIVNYKNGVQKYKNLDGHTIFRKYADFLTEEETQHFSLYANKADINSSVEEKCPPSPKFSRHAK